MMVEKQFVAKSAVQLIGEAGARDCERRGGARARSALGAGAATVEWALSRGPAQWSLVLVLWWWPRPPGVAHTWHTSAKWTLCSGWSTRRRDSRRWTAPPPSPPAPMRPRPKCERLRAASLPSPAAPTSDWRRNGPCCPASWVAAPKTNISVDSSVSAGTPWKASSSAWSSSRPSRCVNSYECFCFVLSLCFLFYAIFFEYSNISRQLIILKFKMQSFQYYKT